MRASDNVTLNVWYKIMKTFTVILNSFNSLVANPLAFSAGCHFLSLSLVLLFLSFLSPSLPTVSLCGVNRFPCCFEALSGLWLELVIQLNTCTQSTIHSPAVFKTGSSTHLLLQQYNTLSSTTPYSLNFLAQHLVPCVYSWFPPQSSSQFGLGKLSSADLPSCQTHTWGSYLPPQALRLSLHPCSVFLSSSISLFLVRFIPLRPLME